MVHSTNEANQVDDQGLLLGIIVLEQWLPACRRRRWKRRWKVARRQPLLVPLLVAVLHLLQWMVSGRASRACLRARSYVLEHEQNVRFEIWRDSRLQELGRRPLGQQLRQRNDGRSASRLQQQLLPELSNRRNLTNILHHSH